MKKIVAAAVAAVSMSWAIPAHAATTAYVHSGCSASATLSSGDVTRITGSTIDCSQGLYVSLIDRTGKTRWSKTYDPAPGISTTLWIPDMTGGRLHVEELNYSAPNTIVNAYL